MLHNSTLLYTTVHYEYNIYCQLANKYCTLPLYFERLLDYFRGISKSVFMILHMIYRGTPKDVRKTPLYTNVRTIHNHVLQRIFPITMRNNQAIPPVVKQV